ncbi:MAG: MGMT family protein [Myxococcota bacterium]|nr:MGMT family protein [Myxococcota bacterium]
MNFRQRVYQVVRAIPAGRVLGYGHVAALCGSARAARQVGYALAALGPGGVDKQGHPVPWQRVIRSSGHIAFAGDPVRGPLQRQLLEAEGITFSGERVPMESYRWSPTVQELEEAIAETTVQTGPETSAEPRG